MNISAQEALERLKIGNEKFVEGIAPDINKDPASFADGQRPFAIILGCSDSRVPAELVFGQGLGDLFVIRVAGNIVAPSQIGSIEFAAAQFGTPIVVVLGHSECGAVGATLDELTKSQESQSPNLKSIVERIKPAVEDLLKNSSDKGDGELMEQAVRANIRASVTKLKSSSAILIELLEQGKLIVVGAEYCLKTGVVRFLED